MLSVHDFLVGDAKQLRAAGVEKVALLLSAGIDSASVLFALLECGIKVKAYSFHIEGRLSKDFVGAQIIAKTFGVEFEEVVLPKDTETLARDVVRLVKLGCKKKTDFECVFPMLYAYPQIEENVIASGFASEGHFCVTKKGIMHFKDKIDTFRSNFFANPNACQKQLRTRLAKKYGKTLFDPYYSTELFQYLLGTSWNEVNKPHFKQPILNAFPEQFSKNDVYVRSNLQKGDSGIAEAFEALLKTNMNERGHKSVIGVYNDAIRRYGNGR